MRFFAYYCSLLLFVVGACTTPSTKEHLAFVEVELMERVEPGAASSGVRSAAIGQYATLVKKMAVIRNDEVFNLPAYQSVRYRADASFDEKNARPEIYYRELLDGVRLQVYCQRLTGDRWQAAVRYEESRVFQPMPTFEIEIDGHAVQLDLPEYDMRIVDFDLSPQVRGDWIMDVRGSDGPPRLLRVRIGHSTWLQENRNPSKIYTFPPSRPDSEDAWERQFEELLRDAPQLEDKGIS